MMFVSQESVGLLRWKIKDWKKKSGFVKRDDKGPITNEKEQNLDENCFNLHHSP